METASPERDDSRVQTLLGRLASVEEPVSREGAGILIAVAPDERYRLQFRLIARDPDTFRLEIFDPFGRPMLYVVSYLGETHIFSMAEKKEVPLTRSFSGPLAPFSQMPLTEISKIFWGRVPIFPYDSFQIRPAAEEGNETVRILLEGPVQQELWITPHPFSLNKTRIISPSKEVDIEMTFSDFSEVAGNRIPLRCEIKDGSGEKTLTLRYETLVPRTNIPDEVFQMPDLSKTKP